MKGREQTVVESNDPEGIVFDIQRFSLHDGPGIRTIVFLKGCPLHCLWCSNPESQKFSQEIMFNAQKCIDCGTCIDVCPRDAVSENNQTYRIQTELCDLCGRCCEECPTQALKWSGRRFSVSAVLAEIEKDRAFYESSGGGVTASGGEPLRQPVFLKELLAACRSRGIHTAVETCGFVKWSCFQDILDVTDLFLYDLKHLDPTAHEKMTGCDNRLILENIEKLSRTGANIIVRMPMIPGLNDSEKNINATAKFMTTLGIHEIHLLPYHNYGESKYTMLGKDYSLKRMDAATDQDLEMSKRLFEAHGLITNIGGE